MTHYFSAWWCSTCHHRGLTESTEVTPNTHLSIFLEHKASGCPHPAIQGQTIRVDLMVEDWVEARRIFREVVSHD